MGIQSSMGYSILAVALKHWQAGDALEVVNMALAGICAEGHWWAWLSLPSVTGSQETVAKRWLWASQPLLIILALTCSLCRSSSMGQL